MDFYTVLQTRRSVRSFSAENISDHVLNKILDAARIAPSESNRQPWTFIVVRDRETMLKLVPLCDDQAFVAQAPVLIVACGRNIHFNRGNYMGDHSMLVDVAVAFDHLTLAARAEDLGTCWICSFDNKAIKQLLGIPADEQVVALTPLGYPASASVFKSVKDRKKLEEIVRNGKW